MTNIKFKSSEKAAEVDKAIFLAWESKMITVPDAIYRMTENNDLPKRIPYSDFVNAARELGYVRGRHDWNYEEDQEE